MGSPLRAVPRVREVSAGAVSPADAEGARQLDEAARALSPLGQPVIVYCASHSGSRLLAQMLQRLGVFMGAHANDSEDSLDVFELVRYLVEVHAPDFSKLFRDGDPALTAKLLATFDQHLGGRAEGQRWGWKLPETGHVLPVIARLFPGARYVHLLRDGRDVAFSPFVAPKAPFWRKIYFNDDQIFSWRGHAMTQRAYRKHGHEFNAARWVNSVSLGRAHGAMLAERYLEMRYEALVRDPAAELARLAEFLAVEPPPGPSDWSDVRTGSVGKWRDQPAGQLAEVRAVIEPTLGAFGYPWTEGGTMRASVHRALAVLSGRGRRRERCRPSHARSPGGWGGCSGSGPNVSAPDRRRPYRWRLRRGKDRTLTLWRRLCPLRYTGEPDRHIRRSSLAVDTRLIKKWP